MFNTRIYSIYKHNNFFGFWSPLFWVNNPWVHGLTFVVINLAMSGLPWTGPWPLLCWLGSRPTKLTINNVYHCAHGFWYFELSSPLVTFFFFQIYFYIWLSYVSLSFNCVKLCLAFFNVFLSLKIMLHWL